MQLLLEETVVNYNLGVKLLSGSNPSCFCLTSTVCLCCLLMLGFHCNITNIIIFIVKKASPGLPHILMLQFLTQHTIIVLNVDYYCMSM